MFTLHDLRPYILSNKLPCVNFDILVYLTYFDNGTGKYILIVCKNIREFSLYSVFVWYEII